MTNTYTYDGIMFGTILSVSIMALFVFFFIKRKDQRIPIFTLMCIGSFWIYFGENLAPSITEISGVLLYSIKAITDLFCAVLFLVLHVNNEDGKKGVFHLSKYLAYIFWANFSINVLSAIEFNTSYAIVYSMYGGVVTLLNIAQVLILFKGIQDYVSRPRKSNHNFVFNRAKHGNSHVGFPDSLGSGKKNSGKETKE